MKNIVVITGASSGIGKEFAIQLDKKIKVDEFWVIARRIDKLEELKNILSTPIKTIPLDLSKKESFDEYKKLLDEEKPNIKYLVNCSGYGKFNHYENISNDVNMNMIDLNVKAVVSMIDFSLPYIEDNANIINIASCAGFQPIPYINMYASTKAFVLSYTRALAKELKYRKIKVTAICPYWTKTGFFDRAVEKDKKQVVIKYNAMYDATKVVKKAIKDNMKDKDVSAYGFINNFQKMLAKILPHKFVMKIWCNMQKFNGTKDIR